MHFLYFPLNFEFDDQFAGEILVLINKNIMMVIPYRLVKSSKIKGRFALMNPIQSTKGQLATIFNSVLY